MMAQKLLTSNKIVLLDGGMSNELNRRVSFDVNKEKLWTAKALITDPEAVTETHLAYLKAGAEIIETASYQATVEGFKKFMELDAEKAKKYIKDSALLAKAAVDKYVNSEDFDENKRSRPLVAGSLGPYGVFLCDGSEYSGKYTATQAQIEEMHLPRITALVEGGVDLLAIETNPSLREVEIILNLLKNHFPNVKSWVSFSIREGNPKLSACGDSLKEAYERVAKFSQVLAFGINCCRPVDVTEFLREAQGFSAERKLKLIVYPNSGQHWISGQGWINEALPTLDTYLKTWTHLGVGVVGGCCQVGSDQIAKIHSCIDK